MTPVQNGAILVVEVLVGLYLLALMLRLLFQLFRVDFRNPISQMIVTVTNPVLRPLRRYVPGFYGIDMASVILILIVGAIKFYVLAAIAGVNPGPIAALFRGLLESLNTICWILLIAIIASAILSWVAPRSYHPAVQVIHGISQPLLAPFRRFIPSLGGLDISPIFALLAIQLVQTTVIPLLGRGLFQLGLI